MGSPPPRGFSAPGPATQAEDPHRETVRHLSSDDFAVRTSASEALVAAGEDALPALAEAGDAPVPVHGGRATASATRPVVEAILAAVGEVRLVALLSSPGVSVRRVAAEELGRRGAWNAVPALVSGLGDDDAGVREAAAAAIRRVTGRADVVAPASRGDAAAVVARWREWWEREGRGLAPKPPAAGGS
jgi:HEAT repeat protein